MSEVNMRPKITPLVRQYSIKAEQELPDDALSQALGSVVKKQDEEEKKAEQHVHHWKTWLQFGETPSDAALNPLEDQRKEVVDLWQRFCHLLPSEGGSSQPPDSVPTIATLYNAVVDAQDAWDAQKKKGFGKAKDRFFTFLETMDDHSYLFKVIPSGDKYISLITGVVSSVVKASVNHKKIADGFSLALVEISSDLKFVQRKTKISDSLEMRKLVVELYVKVFKFLCHAMSWFKKWRNRLKVALNKNFYDDTVKAMVDGIQGTVKKVQDEAAHIAEGRIHDFGEQFKNIDKQVKGVDGLVKETNERLEDYFLSLQIVGNENRNDDYKKINQRLDNICETLGISSARTLGAVEEHVLHDRISRKGAPREIEYPGLSSAEEVEEEEVDAVSDDDSDGPCTRYEIQELSRAFAMYVEDGREEISNALSGVSRPLLPDEVLIEMQKWIKALESRMIWVEGAPSTFYWSGLSLAAMHLCAVSMSAGIPCVSFFGKPRYSFASAAQPPMPHREAAVVALLYSIISQLARLLPAEFEATEGLNESQFRLLDGSIDSVPAALQLIQALLAHAPPSLIWVLDGLQLAENQDTVPHLTGLIGILRDQEDERVSKVCFTTDGNSLVLMRAMNVFERVDASRMAQGRPGQLLKGGSDINELRGPMRRGGY